MQNFNATAFLALPAAKAKIAALALFDAAMIEPAADWRGVAYALHAVVSRKRSAAPVTAASEETPDTGEFAEWADYQPAGKGTAIARGRVTITFADGWSKTVGLLAGKTAKGRKPWSIAHAVRFAVICYKAAAMRRAVGHDDMLYHGDITLDGLVSCPEIISMISAESAETVDGDLIWNPCEANAFTRDQRAGRVDLATYQRGEDGQDCALSLARLQMLREIGFLPTPAEIHMRRANRDAVESVNALLFPWNRGRNPERVEWCESAFADLMDADPDGFPRSRDTARLVESERRDADHETMLAASEIVGTGREPDAYSDGLSMISYVERFRLVEDALIAWPARDDVEIEVTESTIDVAEEIDVTDNPGDIIAPAEATEPVMEDSHDVEEGHSEPLAAVEAESGADVAAESAAPAYSITEARYAKGKMIIRCPSPDGFKTRAASLAQRVGGRYVGRAGGYSVSPAQAERFKAIYHAGEVAEADTTATAVDITPEPAKPASKPRYRYNTMTGSWDLVEPAGEIERIAA